MLLRTTITIFALVLNTALACEALAGELEGSAWRLLNISSMDDSVWIPDHPDKYTLSFAAGEQVAIRADCNIGTGSWASASPGQITFGPVAATRALCAPESLSEMYLAQFEWVRSYTMRDGHLYMATMADGSIIEFEPLPPVVATVYGETIRAAEAAELQSKVITRVFDRYAAQLDIGVDELELTAFLDNMRRGMDAEGLAAEEDLTPEEVQQVNVMRRRLGESIIRQWKINKSLYGTYGGRIIYQQLGPEPLDAYRQFFQARQAAGDFTIDNPAMAEEFWGYFTDESRHDFMAPGGEDAARAFTTPPWEVSQ